MAADPPLNGIRVLEFAGLAPGTPKPPSLFRGDWHVLTMA